MSVPLDRPGAGLSQAPGTWAGRALAVPLDRPAAGTSSRQGKSRCTSRGVGPPGPVGCQHPWTGRAPAKGKSEAPSRELEPGALAGGQASPGGLKFGLPSGPRQ